MVCLHVYMSLKRERKRERERVVIYLRVYTSMKKEREGIDEFIVRYGEGSGEIKKTSQLSFFAIMQNIKNKWQGRTAGETAGRILYMFQ